MKARILTFLVIAATVCGHANIIDDVPSYPPTNVINALETLGENYGIKAKKSVTEKRSSVDNSIEACVIILPFECPNGRGIITAVKDAYMKDKDLGFQFGINEPGQGNTFKTYTSDRPNEYIMTREDLYQGYYFINVKNDDNPQLRDHYGLQWQAFGDRIKGKIFLITSLRPDLVEKNATNYFAKVSIDSSFVSRGGQNLEHLFGVDPFEQFSALSNPRNTLFDTAGFSRKEALLFRQLEAYGNLLKFYEDQIKELEERYMDNTVNPVEQRNINKRLRKLHKQVHKTTNRMQKLIKKMA